MIVWGGFGAEWGFNTGGRYNPGANSWAFTTTYNAPTGRHTHKAVWTGSEMIVWGGEGTLGYGYLNTGGRYDPSTDSWTATSTTNAPSGRSLHKAVWTGSEMIVWGGFFYDGNDHWLNTGGRYNPRGDRWYATSTSNAPSARQYHTAVWTGSEMIVWGGWNGSNLLNTGGKYNPRWDTWTSVSTSNAPSARVDHTGVWTGSEMIVWGGYSNSELDTGGRYDPWTDTWTATNTTNAPGARADHTAVWTGNEMIVWGGSISSTDLNTGGKYNPGADNWVTTSTTNVPDGRLFHTAVWTGSEMIVWGGGSSNALFNTGGRV
jgi:N-acetylneuraminic acid mutarotase